MSKLYHEGKFKDKLSNEFFKSYESAEELLEYHRKILTPDMDVSGESDDPLNY